MYAGTQTSGHLTTLPMSGLAGDPCDCGMVAPAEGLAEGWGSPTSSAFLWGLVNVTVILHILRQAGKEQHSHSQPRMQSASSLLDGNCVRSQAGSMRLLFWEKKQRGKKCTCPNQMAANLW